MKIVKIAQEKEAVDFARRAAEAFQNNPRLHTFGEGAPKEGELLAIRWNDPMVLVVRLDEFFEPALYSAWEMTGKGLPPLESHP